MRDLLGEDEAVVGQCAGWTEEDHSSLPLSDSHIAAECREKALASILYLKQSPWLVYLHVGMT